jgi:hypothetical protein
MRKIEEENNAYGSENEDSISAGESSVHKSD